MVWTDPVSQDVDALRRLSDLHGVPILAIHAPCLIITQRVWGTDPWAKLQRAQAAAETLGAETVVVHPPFRWQREYAREFVRGVNRMGDETDVRFAVENMFPLRARGRSVSTYSPDWDPTDEDYPDFTLDLSHTAVSGVDALEMAARMGDRLTHVHIADGTGSVKDEHLVPGRGDQPCAELLEGLAGRGFAGLVVVEVNTRKAENRAEREVDLAEALAFTRLNLAAASSPEDTAAWRRARRLSRAARDLERELGQGPAAPAARLARDPRPGRGLPAGDQGRRRGVPDRRGARRSATRWPTTARAAGTASRCSPGSASTTCAPAWPAGPTSRARRTPGRSPRSAAGCGCGRCTCRTAAPSTTRTTSTSSPGSPPCATPSPPTSLPGRRSRCAGTTTSRAPTTTSGTSRKFVDSTHVTPAERAAVDALEELGLVDVVPRPGKGTRPFTYWDYRAGRLHKDEGMRIDYLLLSAALAAGVTDAHVDREARKGTGASDHAPVLADLAL